MAPSMIKSVVLVLIGLVIGFFGGLKFLPLVRTIVHGSEEPLILNEPVEFFGVPKGELCSPISKSAIARGGLLAGTRVLVRKQGPVSWLTVTVMVDQPLSFSEAPISSGDESAYQCVRGQKRASEDSQP